MVDELPLPTPERFFGPFRFRLFYQCYSTVSEGMKRRGEKRVRGVSSVSRGASSVSNMPEELVLVSDAE